MCRMNPYYNLGGISSLRLPDLETLIFGAWYGQSFEHVTLPNSLLKLTWTSDLASVTLPSNLHTLNFGKCFNESLVGVTFPCSLRVLRFGSSFVQTLEDVTFPSNLETFEKRRLLELDFGPCCAAKQSADVNLRRRVLPELGRRQLSRQSAEFDLWSRIQRELGGCDLSKQPDNIDRWPEF